MDIIRFEESFERQQNAVDRRKACQFYTNRSTRIKLDALGKHKVKLHAPPHKTKQQKTDKRIDRPSYLRPIKAPKKKPGVGKLERFKKRSEDRDVKFQSYVEAPDTC